MMTAVVFVEWHLMVVAQIARSLEMTAHLVGLDIPGTAGIFFGNVQFKGDNFSSTKQNLGKGGTVQLVSGVSFFYNHQPSILDNLCTL